MTRPIPLLILLLAIAIPLSLLAGRVWLDPWATPNAAVRRSKAMSISLHFIHLRTILNGINATARDGTHVV